MFDHIALARISWRFGAVGWLAGAAVAFTVFILSSDHSPWPPLELHELHLLLLAIVLTGLGRASASATLHTVGTAFLQVRERGTPALRGLAIAAASPSALLVLVGLQFSAFLLPQGAFDASFAPLVPLSAAVLCTWALGLAWSAGMGWLASVLTVRRRARNHEILAADPTHDPRFQPAVAHSFAKAA